MRLTCFLKSDKLSNSCDRIIQVCSQHMFPFLDHLHVAKSCLPRTCQPFSSGVNLKSSPSYGSGESRAPTSEKLWTQKLKMRRLAIYTLLMTVGLKQVTKLRWPKLGVEGYHIPGIPTIYYAEPGDIYFSVLLRLSDGVNEDLLCNNVSLGLNPNIYPFSQGVWWIVNKINTERLISRSLKLGFMVINACSTNSIGMKIHSLRLLRTTHCIVGNGSVCSGRLDSFSDLGHLVAVVNRVGSTQNVALSSMFTPSRIPLVAMTASSDGLSDKNTFPYFSRMVPPDQYQMQAVLSVILLNNWTYVSVLHVEGSYGENAVIRLKDEFNKYKGVCIAAVHKVPERSSQEIADKIVDSLVKHRNARIVVAILEETHVIDIFKSLSRRNLVDPSHFLWIFSDSAADLNYNEWGQYLEGSLFVDRRSTNVREFDQWFLTRKPHDATGDPWFRGIYEHFCKCSFKNATCDSQTPIGSCNIESRSDCIGLLYDAIYTVANATARVLNSTDCLLKRDWKECLTGPRVLGEIRQTRQEGATGWLELTPNGDRLSRYVIFQVIRNSTSTPTIFHKVVLGQYDIARNRLFLERNFSWPNNSQIRSDCSRPCQDGEERILDYKVPCCWSCRRCEVNQVVDRNLSKCETCDLLHWPSDNKDNCVLIPITRSFFSSPFGIGQMLFSSLALVLCFTVGVFFNINNDEKVIKASSIDLSYIILFGLIQGYMATILVVVQNEVTENDDLMCRLYYLLYSTSLTLLYAPLLLRVFRIYRIFVGRIRSAKRLRYIQPFQLKVDSLVLVLIMILIGSGNMVLQTWSISAQPDRYTKYVEHGCQIPFMSLSMAFGYNLFLLAICSVLALKTRHLPENFNESGFICASACTSFFAMLCFIPVYFRTNSVITQVKVLNTVISINHTMNLFLLFVSKIYAVLFFKNKSAHSFLQSSTGTTFMMVSNTKLCSVTSTSVDVKLRGMNSSPIVRKKPRKGLSVSVKLHEVKSSPIDSQSKKTLSPTIPEVSAQKDENWYTGDPIWTGPLSQSSVDSQARPDAEDKINPAAPSAHDSFNETEKSANINQGEEHGIDREKNRKGFLVGMKLHEVKSSSIDSESKTTIIPEVSAQKDENLYAGDSIWTDPLSSSPVDSQAKTDAEDSRKMNPSAPSANYYKHSINETEKSANINQVEEHGTSGPATASQSMSSLRAAESMDTVTNMASYKNTVDILANTITESKTAIRKWSQQKSANINQGMEHGTSGPATTSQSMSSLPATESMDTMASDKNTVDILEKTITESKTAIRKWSQAIGIQD